MVQPSFEAALKGLLDKPPMILENIILYTVNSFRILRVIVTSEGNPLRPLGRGWGTGEIDHHPPTVTDGLHVEAFE
jgi:hypothetical protein